MSNFYTPPQGQAKPKSKALAKIKQAWDENPIGVALVATALLTAAGKLIDSIGSYQSKRAYAKDAERRYKK